MPHDQDNPFQWTDSFDTRLAAAEAEIVRLRNYVDALINGQSILMQIELDRRSKDGIQDS